MRPCKTRNNSPFQTLVMTRFPTIVFSHQLYFKHVLINDRGNFLHLKKLEKKLNFSQILYNVTAGYPLPNYHGLLSRARRLRATVNKSKTNRCNTLFSTPCLTSRMGSSYSITNDTDKDIWVWDGVNVDAIIWGTSGAFAGVGASKYSTAKPYLTFL